MDAGFLIAIPLIACAIALPLLLLFIIVMAVIKSSSNKSKNNTASREEQELLQSLLKQLDHMDQRIGNLETILSDRRKP